MRIAARARHELARRPWIHWCVVAALAAGAAWSVAGAVADVERARAAWGATRDVVVAAHAVEPGTALAGAATRRTVPVAMVPDDAIDAVAPDAVARRRIGRGEILTIDDVVATSGAAALAPRGTLVVTVAEALPGPAATGDRIVVAADGVALVDDALVVGRVDGGVLVAVRADRAPTVAAAAAAPAGVALLLVP